MPLMQSPYVRKPVVVPEGMVADFRAAGFSEVEREEPAEKPVQRKSRRTSSK